MQTYGDVGPVIVSPLVSSWQIGLTTGYPQLPNLMEMWAPCLPLSPALHWVCPSMALSAAVEALDANRAVPRHEATRDVDVNHKHGKSIIAKRKTCISEITMNN